MIKLPSEFLTEKSELLSLSVKNNFGEVFSIVIFPPDAIAPDTFNEVNVPNEVTFGCAAV